MSEILTPIAFQLGTGGILGFVVGYALKKLFKIVAVLVGLFAIALIYMGYQGVINVNYGKLAEGVGNLLGNVSSMSGLITSVVVNLPFAGSFLAAMALGLKVG